MDNTVGGNMSGIFDGWTVAIGQGAIVSLRYPIEKKLEFYSRMAGTRLK